MAEEQKQPVETISFRLDSVVLTNILKSCIRSHQFIHKNNLPVEIIIPNVEEVMGVKVVYEATKVKGKKAA